MPPLRGPLAFHSVAQALVDAIMVRLTAEAVTGAAAPERACVYPGLIAWEGTAVSALGQVEQGDPPMLCGVAQGRPLDVPACADEGEARHVGQLPLEADDGPSVPFHAGCHDDMGMPVAEGFHALSVRTCRNGHRYEAKRNRSGDFAGCHICSAEYRRQWRQETRRRLREEATAVLGGACARCGISHPIEFDHVNDDGYLSYKASGKGINRRRVVPHLLLRMYRDIIQHGGGHGVYQLLCCNCNRMKQLYPEDYAKPPTYGPLEGAKC